MAELTFRTNIRRDKWPRWMKQLHEYISRVTQDKELEATREEYQRLKMIMDGYINSIKYSGHIRRASIRVLLGLDYDQFTLVVIRKNFIVTYYYIE